MGDPKALFDSMTRTDPRFAEFVSDCRGKTLEQVCSEYGVDPSLVRGLLGR